MLDFSVYCYTFSFVDLIQRSSIPWITKSFSTTRLVVQAPFGKTRREIGQGTCFLLRIFLWRVLGRPECLRRLQRHLLSGSRTRK